MKKPDFEKIYLVPEDGDYVWDADPDRGESAGHADAIEYVRGDLHQLADLQTDERVANALRVRYLTMRN